MVERRTNGDDLTGRRKGYKTLRDELHRFFRKIWAIVLLIGVVCTAALLGYGYFLGQLDQDAQQRCENQNTRHNNAISALMSGSNEDQLNAKTEEARAEIRRRRDVAKILIDKMAPTTDCNNPVEVKPLPTVTPISEEEP